MKKALLSITLALVSITALAQTAAPTDSQAASGYNAGSLRVPTTGTSSSKGDWDANSLTSAQ